MKEWIHIALISLLISGCATKTITDVAGGDEPSRLFTIEEISNAYFNSSTDEILIDMDLKYETPDKQDRVCFIFDAKDMVNLPLYHTIPLAEEIQTACPDNDHLARYKQIPVFHYVDTNKLARETATSAPWSVEKRLHNQGAYLRSADNENTIILRVPTDNPKTHKGAYLLYPFTIVLDVATSPFQFIYFITTFSTEPYPRWPGWPAAR